MDRLGEGARVVEVGVAGLPPQQVGMRREGEAARDAMVEAGAVLQAEEALGRALAGQERPVALVDVAGDELGALGVGAGDEDGRHAADVGGEPRGVEVADRRLGRDQHLAAEMAALLLATRAGPRNGRRRRPPRYRPS